MDTDTGGPENEQIAPMAKAIAAATNTTAIPHQNEIYPFQTSSITHLSWSITFASR
jgi:hypothetical protein